MMRRPRVSVMRLFGTATEAVEVARTAEDVGLDAIGIGDSPLLYPELHVTMTAVLARTATIAVTPCVTNLATRHWSVHAGAARAFAELAPGRTWITVATGNSAVRMAGLRPQRAEDLERSIVALRRAVGPETRIVVAAAGEQLAGVAGRVGNGLVVGAGTDPDTLRRLLDAAESSRRDPGGGFERWLHVPVNLSRSSRPEDVEAAEDEVLNAVIGFARPALLGGRFPGPEDPTVRDGIEQLVARYDYASHGKAGGAESNPALLASLPAGAAVRRFLLDRFAVIGTPEVVAARLTALVEAGGLDGVSLSIPVGDPIRLVRRLGEEVAPLLRR